MGNGHACLSVQLKPAGWCGSELQMKCVFKLLCPCRIHRRASKSTHACDTYAARHMRPALQCRHVGNRINDRVWCGGPLLGGRQPSCNYTWVCSDSTTGGRRGVLDRSLPVRTCTPTKLTVVNVGDAYMHSTGRRTCTAIM